jgi:phosphatidylserine/phosphatidylglycerophosphate/cardiolipin synthase-like enzyme
MTPRTIEEAYRQVIDRLRRGEEVSLNWLRATFGPELVHRVGLFMDYLVAKGLATRTVAGRKTVFSSGRTAEIVQLLHDKEVEERPTRLPRTQRVATERVVPQPIPTDERPLAVEPAADALVVSAPLSLAGKVATLFEQYAGLNIVDMRVAFRNLLEQAEQEVLLALPFLELDGLMYFTDQVMGLGQRGVRVKILTRELLWPRKYNYAYHQKLKAFAKLVDLYAVGGGGRQHIEVRDYTIRIGSIGDEKLLYEGIHQKMIIVDGELAYVGSGEIRAASFVSNGDVGVIHTGIRARFWRDYFNLFWAEGEPVEHRFFEESIQ